MDRPPKIRSTTRHASCELELLEEFIVDTDLGPFILTPTGDNGLTQLL